MRYAMRSLAGLVGVCVLGWMAATAGAQNLLINGEFEPAGGEAPGWSLQEFVTGSMTAIDSVQIVTSSATQTGVPGERHAWFRAFAGGQTTGPNNLTNAILSQTVPITAEAEYRFSGYSRFEINYSGGVDTLAASPAGPLGPVTSPTVTEMLLEFLDSSNAVLGSPVWVDVKADRIAQIGFPDANDNSYYQHVLTGMAPLGATQARVTAAARDMVWNVGPTQSAFFDSFSFTNTGNPGLELLTNPGLEAPQATGLEDWIVEMNDPGAPDNMQIIRTASFANHTPGGIRGVWLSSFFGEPGTEVDGSVAQTVPGTAGGQYTFTGWSRWETNYTAASTYMELAFLDGSGAVLGTPVTLDVTADRTTQSGGTPKNNTWYQHTLAGLAPEGTASIRVKAGMEDGITPGVNPQAGFFDDFVLQLAPGGTPGDYNGNGVVDAADYTVWRDRFGQNFTLTNEKPGAMTPGVVDEEDYQFWKSQFGAGGSGGTTVAVPEPAFCSLLVIGLTCACGTRRRGVRRA